MNCVTETRFSFFLTVFCVYYNNVINIQENSRIFIEIETSRRILHEMFHSTINSLLKKTNCNYDKTNEKGKYPDMLYTNIFDFLLVLINTI